MSKLYRCKNSERSASTRILCPEILVQNQIYRIDESSVYSLRRLSLCRIIIHLYKYITFMLNGKGWKYLRHFRFVSFTNTIVQWFRRKKSGTIIIRWILKRLRRNWVFFTRHLSIAYKIVKESFWSFFIPFCPMPKYIRNNW